MAIEGPLRELGIHDVFQLLDLSRKTGRLTVTSVLRDNQGTVYFDRGAVIHAAIRSNPHRLGELLLRAGKITEGDLTRIREQQRREGDKRQLGELLLEAGALSRKELERQVRFQVEEVVFEMMSWREGFFSFEEGTVLDAPAEVDIRISTESLLMEGARRIDEWSLIEGKVPHLGVVPVFAALDGEHTGLLDLLPKEWEVLGQIDGARDLRAIAEASAMSEFDVARVMYGLVTTGIVELKPGEGIPPAPPPAPPIPPRRTPEPRPAEPEPIAAAVPAAAVPAAAEAPAVPRADATASVPGVPDSPMPEAAVVLPGSLLHVPSLEHTGMHPVAPRPSAAAVPPAPPATAPAAAPAAPMSAAAAEDALVHVERARRSLRLGDADAAVIAAMAAVEASGGAVEARILLARAQLKAGAVGDALSTVRAALERDMLNPALYRLLGRVAVARGDLADAVAGFERYQRLAPDAPDGADQAHVRAAAEAAARLRDALRELGDG